VEVTVVISRYDDRSPVRFSGSSDGN